MTIGYSPFDPLVWLLFFVCLLAVYLIVKCFHLKYPNYPESVKGASSTSGKVGESPRITRP